MSTLPVGRAPVVAVGTSLGGLDALSAVLSRLPKDFGAAVAVVQHRLPNSDSLLSKLLSERCALPVQEVEDRQAIVGGIVYLAPADYHLLLEEDGFSLDVGPAVNWARPSIDVFFESVAAVSGRPRAGVLLTASTEDGANGIACLSRAGATTIVQNPSEAASAVAPRAALSRCRVDYVLRLHEIADRLVAWTRSQRGALG